eukprot:TRINITY_DN1322_c0_g4_i2.p1 TRINITY_DN1322_c0_g4~~TRINITY_DN1322_c0_g4_i2.p1  ORF type:complete len:110 (+),score=6.94 TRINITY_DN1322_c0_g4_i2:183-512(+)
MKRSIAKLAGGGKFPYPEWVYQPSGGYWRQNPNWLRNSIIGGVLYVGIAGVIFDVSRKHERSPVPPGRPILSQRWRTHADEDDPHRRETAEEYHKNKGSLWSRIWPDSH